MSCLLAACIYTPCLRATVYVYLHAVFACCVHLHVVLACYVYTYTPCLPYELMKRISVHAWIQPMSTP